MIVRLLVPLVERSQKAKNLSGGVDGVIGIGSVLEVVGVDVRRVAPSIVVTGGADADIDNEVARISEAAQGVVVDRSGVCRRNVQMLVPGKHLGGVLIQAPGQTTLDRALATLVLCIGVELGMRVGV